MKTQVVPAIIPESLEYLRKRVGSVSGIVSIVQIDIIDGIFAPSTSWPYKIGQDEELDKITSGEEKLLPDGGVDFEVDMMVSKPEEAAERWIEMGANGIIVHLESINSPEGIIEEAKEKGVKVGVATIPSTPIELLFEWAGKVDFVQLMGNDRIGYHGVQLDERVYEKAERLREKYSELTIGVDIGVNFDTAPRLIDSGVNKLVAGSAIFESRSPEEAIKRLQNS